uniref:Synaptotagmin-like protein 2 n=1 Tax=Cyprinodon variegatus TaxID=28743 RepID=A0A3Q2C783_CYPVA
GAAQTPTYRRCAVTGNPQQQLSSRSSIYPLDTEVQGSIQFAVNYIQKLEEFQVFVVNCRGLAIAETKKNLSDPYVKCYLAPDKTRLGKKKTTVKKRTLNPTYNEVLKFKIPLEELKKQTLIVSVWHNDLFGRNSFLGDVDLNLSEWDFKNAEINEYKLKAKVIISVHIQCKLVSSIGKGISTTEAGELLIWVKDCKDLPQVRRVIINPFVKCTVLPDTSRKSQQKTRVVKRTANPLFNHTMVYDGFQSEDLRQACVEITVWDRDRLHNHFIGGVRLGPGTGKSYGVDVAWMDSTTTEVNLWNKMLHSNGEWVEDVLPLRMLVMAKGL